MKNLNRMEKILMGVRLPPSFDPKLTELSKEIDQIIVNIKCPPFQSLESLNEDQDTLNEYLQHKSVLLHITDLERLLDYLNSNLQLPTEGNLDEEQLFYLFAFK